MLGLALSLPLQEKLSQPPLPTFQASREPATPSFQALVLSSCHCRAAP